MPGQGTHTSQPVSASVSVRTTRCLPPSPNSALPLSEINENEGTAQFHTTRCSFVDTRPPSRHCAPAATNLCSTFTLPSSRQWCVNGSAAWKILGLALCTQRSSLEVRPRFVWISSLLLYC